MEAKCFMIKNLMPGLIERGKIKIGMKGETRPTKSGGTFQLPVKLDHFVITNMVRGADGNFTHDEMLHKALGEKPTKIPVRLLYDDIELNFQTRYTCYRGTAVLCFGDGETGHPLVDQKGTRQDCACPCQRQDPKYTGPDKCKINGSLSVMIDRADVVGGVWKFRTTSYNSVVGILSSLTLIKRISGGVLAGLPLELTIQPKTVANPVDGKMQTIYVVGVEFKGSVKTLQDTGYAIALDYQKHNVRIGHIEAEAKRLLAFDAAGWTELPEDIKEEFYPEAEATGAPAAAATEAPDLFPPGDEPGAGDTAGQHAGAQAPAAAPAAAAAAAQAAGTEAAAKKNPVGRPAKQRVAPAAAPAASPNKVPGPFKLQPGAAPASKPVQAPAAAPAVATEAPPAAQGEAPEEAPPFAGPDFDAVTGPAKAAPAAAPAAAAAPAQAPAAKAAPAKAAEKAPAQAAGQVDLF